MREAEERGGLAVGPDMSWISCNGPVLLDAAPAGPNGVRQPGEQKIRMGVSPLIGSHLVARAFRMVQHLPVPRDLVLREANMQDLREHLLGGGLDIILIPAVAAIPRFEHRVIDVESIVVVSPDTVEATPLALEEAGKESFILVAGHLRSDHLHHPALPGARVAVAHLSGRSRRLPGAGGPDEARAGLGDGAPLETHLPRRPPPSTDERGP
uniref:LysR substrate-binding domain-containing protein n=1 Tax=Streptomyces calvus TaxID=67282 RepID=UPI00351545E8